MKFPREFPGKRNATKMASSEQSVFLVGNLTFKCWGNWVDTGQHTNSDICLQFTECRKYVCMCVFCVFVLFVFVCVFCIYVCVEVRQGG